MKEFKVYVGVKEDHLIEVFHGGLKNDALQETFILRHTNAAGIHFPTRFVKIVPLSAYGQSFHISIWHVSLRGVIDQSYVQNIDEKFQQHRETAAMRQILKYLRQRRLLTPFNSILQRSNLRLEHPVITSLHSSLVLQGNWVEVEKTLKLISDAGLFDEYLHSCQPHAIWKRIHAVDADGDFPGKRGGHAMCIDHENGKIYLLGGWDGQKSLDDFWVFDIKANRWKLIGHSTSKERNGPGARSCHKMVFDGKTGSIFLLGRLSDLDGIERGEALMDVDNPPAPTPLQGAPATNSSESSVVLAGDAVPTTAFCSEFYRYRTRGIDKGKWEMLTFDTASLGGPPLIFDHQMVIDSDAQVLYVFGGRVVDGAWKTIKCSGLYSYTIRNNKWRLLQPTDESGSTQINIPTRFGHSMVLEPSLRKLYIFAGQREHKYLADFYSYDIATNTATELFSNFSTLGGPDPCFTQRAVVDTNLKEIYMFCGLTRSHIAGSETMLQTDAPSWLFRYDSKPGSWSQILSHPDLDSPKTHESEEPQPRYAHQVVYDPGSGTVYMHGGNGGTRGAAGGMGLETMERQASDGDTDDGSEENGREVRLDDFWSMTLNRPAPDQLMRKAIYRSRQQQFREMCEESPAVKALNFLQTEVSSVVDHEDPEETELFRSLLSHLLAPSDLVEQPSGSSTETIRPGKRDGVDTEIPPAKRSWGGMSDESSKDSDNVVMASEALVTSPSVELKGFGQVHSISSQVLRAVEDPEERRSEGRSLLTGERYEQRQRVFDALLEFIGQGEKEPGSDLLDLVDFLDML